MNSEDDWDALSDAEDKEDADITSVAVIPCDEEWGALSDPDSSPNENDENEETPQSIANGLMKKTRPRTSNNPKTMRATKLRAQIRLAKEARRTMDEKLMAASIQFESGQKAFPHLHKAMAGPSEDDLRLRKNAASMCLSTGRHDRSRVIRHLSNGLPPKFVSERLKVKPATLKRARETRAVDTIGANFENQQYAHSVTRQKIGDIEQALLVEFFEETTTPPVSGAKTQTRNLEMLQQEWEADLYARWPVLLRRQARRSPQLLLNHQGGRYQRLTRFQASVRAAHYSATVAGFNAADERSKRLAIARKRYARKIAVQEGRMRPYSEVELKAQANHQEEIRVMMTDEAFDPAQYEIRPVVFDTFLTVLKDKKLRFTKFSSPHPCRICEQGPVNVAVLESREKEQKQLKIDKNEVPKTLIADIRALGKLVKVWETHKAQLATGRLSAKKQRDAMPVGWVSVVRDYVNHHDHTGSHVKCLVFVLQWRETEGGPLKILKIRNFCSDKKTMSTDSYNYCDVLDFHLRRKGDHSPGHFDMFTVVLMEGDHGPHFASRFSMYFESVAYRKYGKEIRLNFYTSYHAFGRADGAGAEDKRSAAKDMRAGIPREGAAAYTEMTNQSNDVRSIAYTFRAINRSLDVLPPESELVSPPSLKKWTQVLFEYPGRCQETEGIVLHRLVAGEGPLEWSELRKRPGSIPLCTHCSTGTHTHTLSTH